MITAQAYVLRETGVIPKLENIQVSDELTVGQVRLRVLYSGLCATQMEEIFVSSRNAKHMPHLFGHEGVGVIEDIGPGVETKQIGDVCIIHWRQSSMGLDSSPGNYFVAGKRINSGKVVTFSSNVVVPENRVTKAFTDQNLSRAALLGCAFPTGWGSLIKVGSAAREDKVLILGLGGVGLAILQSARNLGVSSINFVEANEIRWPSGHQMLGARGLIALDQESFHEISPTIVLDTTGSDVLLEQVIDWAATGTRVVLVGMPKAGAKSRINTQKLLDGVILRGSNGGEVDFAVDYPNVLAAFEGAPVDSPPFEVGQHGAQELAKAISDHNSGRFWRNVLSFSAPETTPN